MQKKSSRDYEGPDAYVTFRCVGCGKKYVDDHYWIVRALPVMPKTTGCSPVHGVCRTCNPSGKVLTQVEIDRICRKRKHPVL